MLNVHVEVALQALCSTHSTQFIITGALSVIPGRSYAEKRLGRGPSAGAVGLEFPSKGIRREFEGNSGIPFEGNSKGTRRVQEVGTTTTGASLPVLHHI